MSTRASSGIADPFCYFRGLFVRTSSTPQVLASIMNESRGFRDGCAHRNRRRIIRPGIRACSAPSPIGEMVTSSRHGTDRDNYSAVSPPASGIHRATGSMRHRQVILCPEKRCVIRVSGGSNSVRNSSTTGPVRPEVSNVYGNVLLKRCGQKKISIDAVGVPGARPT